MSIELLFKKNNKTEAEEKNNQIPVAQKISLGKKLLYLTVTIWITGSLGAAGFFYLQYKKAIEKKEVLVQDEVSAVTGKIRVFMELPENEVPMLATITDLKKLKGQVFFEKAQSGDKVLVYEEAKKAILYRPSSNRVIEVTSLISDATRKPMESVAGTTDNKGEKKNVEEENKKDLDNNQEENTSSEENRQRELVIYNGTNTEGLARKIADKLGELENTEILKTGNAKGNYASNLIIDLTGNNAALVKKISAIIGGQESELPIEEKKPEGDILIIGGEDMEKL